MKRILVYGSLRKGLWNYAGHLKGCEPVSIYRVKGFEMYDLGGYPMVIRNKDADSIVVEEYLLEDKHFENIKLMEWSAGYVCAQLTIQDKEYNIFCYTWIPPNSPFIEGGDYVEYIKRK